MVNYVPYVILIIATALLILFTSLLLYFKPNIILLVFFILTIVLGLIACIIFIYDRTPSLKKDVKLY